MIVERGIVVWNNRIIWVEWCGGMVTGQFVHGQTRMWSNLYMKQFSMWTNSYSWFMVSLGLD